VPLDHSAPNGATIDLALLRARAAVKSERVGVLLVNTRGRFDL
jgi:hypothetical protein